MSDTVGDSSVYSGCHRLLKVWPRLGDATLSESQVIAINLDTDETMTELNGSYSSSARAHEGIKDYAAVCSGSIENKIFYDVEWLYGGVFIRAFAARLDIKVAFAAIRAANAFASCEMQRIFCIR